VRAGTEWRTTGRGVACYVGWMTSRKPAPEGDLTDDQRRALDMLAGSHHGCTESILRAHGFGVVLLADLMRTGLAKAEAERTQAGLRVRILITDAGKRALAG
jgi:hypothetical protein